VTRPEKSQNSNVSDLFSPPNPVEAELWKMSALLLEPKLAPAKPTRVLNEVPR